MSTPILIIHVYFGKLPSFFDFWLRSCEENRDVDFLIVTDQKLQSDKPNITVYNCNLFEVKKRAEKLLGIQVSLETPRKLCDYKVLFPLLFAEFSSEYEFCGFCDSDLIFGRIRNFLTEDILSKYDYLLVLGHLHIQRVNCSKFEKVWKTAKGIGDNAFYEPDFDPSRFLQLDNGPQWKALFSSPRNYVFDEMPYGVPAQYYRLYPKKVWTGFTVHGRCFDDIDPVPLHLRDSFNSYEAYLGTHYYKLSNLFPCYVRHSNGDKEFDEVVYEKKNGSLYRISCNKKGELVEQECLYAHFLHRKMAVRTAVSNHYLIVPNKFIDYQEVTTVRIKQWSTSRVLKIQRIWQAFVFQAKRSITLYKKIKGKLCQDKLLPIL